MFGAGKQSGGGSGSSRGGSAAAGSGSSKSTSKKALLLAAQAAAAAESSAQRSLEESLAEAVQQQQLRRRAASGAGGSAGRSTAALSAVQESQEVDREVLEEDDDEEQAALAEAAEEAADGVHTPAPGSEQDDDGEAQAAAEAAELEVRLLEAQLRAAQLRVRAQRKHTAQVPGGPTARTAAAGPERAAQHSAAGGAAPTQETTAARHLVAFDSKHLPAGFKTLTYAEAPTAGVLADWLFTLEQMFDAQQVAPTDDTNRLRGANFCWDRAMHEWWADVKEQLALTSGAAVRFADLKRALRAQFQPTGDKHTAFQELLGAQQQSNENMDQYMRRLAAVYSRAGSTAGDERAIVAAVLKGVHARCMPIGIVAVRRAAMERMERGRVVSFAWLRQELTLNAHFEPDLSKLFPSGSSGGAGHNGAAPKRVAPITQQQSTADGGGEGAAPGPGAGPEGARKCYKCSQEGHIASECTDAMERRSCYKCGKAGHLRKDCPKSKNA